MTAERRLKPSLRRVLSILILVHLAAVIAPPLAFQARGPIGTSPSINTILRPVQGYSQFVYMDRGYAFFAPDPGPSHLIQARITSGDQATEQMFPDRQQQWPRLLYHRHFMLSEFLEEIYQPLGPPAELVELEPAEAELWVRLRARYEHVRQSMVDHLQHENHGQLVEIRRIEHLVPDLIEYQREPIALTDQRLYRVLLDQPIDLNGELTDPVGPAETIPPPSGQPADQDDQDVNPLPPDRQANQQQEPSKQDDSKQDDSEQEQQPESDDEASDAESFPASGEDRS